jgi:prepilin-type N-terminal cleavage/methylation domain-containing protein
MKKPQLRFRSTSRGFTIIELLVVIAIIVTLASILIPALSKAMATARTTEDKSHLKNIHEAMLLYSTKNEGNLPQPSVIGAGYVDTDGNSVLQHDFTDTTANLMSYMIGQNYFDTALLLSPVETNENIADMNAETLKYNNPNVIDGNTILWDPTFVGDISLATAGSPAHNSYAHTALWGERPRLKWHSSATSSDVLLGNRGPAIQILGQSMTLDSESNTMQFHGRDDAWSGVIVSGDGSVRLAASVLPDGIAYQPLNGQNMGPDNLFFPDWTDLGADPTLSGDNWLVICNEADAVNNVFNVVWD